MEGGEEEEKERGKKEGSRRGGVEGREKKRWEKKNNLEGKESGKNEAKIDGYNNWCPSNVIIIHKCLVVGFVASLKKNVKRR